MGRARGRGLKCGILDWRIFNSVNLHARDKLVLLEPVIIDDRPANAKTSTILMLPHLSTYPLWHHIPATAVRRRDVHGYGT